MKIASLVPSWTETLIACGADVVARTRFCIHPREAIARIPAIGGTKDFDREKLVGSGAELLVVDREENRKEMVSQLTIPFFDSHVCSIDDLIRDLRRLSVVVAADAQVSLRLSDLASRWESALVKSRSLQSARSWAELPGVMEWIKRPADFKAPIAPGSELVYMIWRDPWMAASPQTFIGSMLSELGFGAFHRSSSEIYPKLELSSFDPARTILLFSSEPYPFHKKIAALKELPFASAIVDGESYSWFGVRSLAFFEAALT